MIMYYFEFVRLGILWPFDVMISHPLLHVCVCVCMADHQSVCNWPVNFSFVCNWVCSLFTVIFFLYCFYLPYHFVMFGHDINSPIETLKTITSKLSDVDAITVRWTMDPSIVFLYSSYSRSLLTAALDKILLHPRPWFLRVFVFLTFLTNLQ